MVKHYVMILLLSGLNITTYAVESTTTEQLFSSHDYQTFCAIHKIADIVWQLIEETKNIDPCLSIERPLILCPSDVSVANYATKQGLFFAYWCSTPDGLVTPWGRVNLIDFSLGAFSTWKIIKIKLDQRIVQRQCEFGNEEMQKKIGEIYKIYAVDEQELPDAQEHPDVYYASNNKGMIQIIWNAMAEKYEMERYLKSAHIKFLN